MELVRGMSAPSALGSPNAHKTPNVVELLGNGFDGEDQRSLGNCPPDTYITDAKELPPSTLGTLREGSLAFETYLKSVAAKLEVEGYSYVDPGEVKVDPRLLKSKCYTVLGGVIMVGDGITDEGQLKIRHEANDIGCLKGGIIPACGPKPKKCVACFTHMSEDGEPIRIGETLEPVVVFNDGTTVIKAIFDTQALHESYRLIGTNDVPEKWVHSLHGVLWIISNQSHCHTKFEAAGEIIPVQIECTPVTGIEKGWFWLPSMYYAPEEAKESFKDNVEKGIILSDGATVKALGFSAARSVDVTHYHVGIEQMMAFEPEPEPEV